MIYTVTLNPAIDYVVQLSHGLNLGSLNRNAAEDFQFGGKGINVSNVLHTLGHESIALGFIAGFTGDSLEKGLQEMGLQTQFLQATGMTRVNVKIKATEETEINGMGPALTEENIAQLYAQLDTLCAGDILVLSGSIPSCLPNDTYEKITARLQDRDISIVVDASGDLLVNVLKYNPFLIKPNDFELGEIFGKELSSDEEIIACAKKLQDMGGRNILVSLAGNGALLLDETGKTHRIHCPKGQVINSVGAGDSMVAGFLAGWLETGDYSYALTLGTAAGSATAFSLGLADKDHILQLLSTL